MYNVKKNKLRRVKTKQEKKNSCFPTAVVTITKDIFSCLFFLRNSFGNFFLQDRVSISIALKITLPRWCRFCFPIFYQNWATWKLDTHDHKGTSVSRPTLFTYQNWSSRAARGVKRPRDRINGRRALIPFVKNLKKRHAESFRDWEAFRADRPPTRGGGRSNSENAATRYPRPFWASLWVFILPSTYFWPLTPHSLACTAVSALSQENLKLRC